MWNRALGIPPQANPPQANPAAATPATATPPTKPSTFEDITAQWSADRDAIISPSALSIPTKILRSRMLERFGQDWFNSWEPVYNYDKSIGAPGGGEVRPSQTIQSFVERSANAANIANEYIRNSKLAQTIAQMVDGKDFDTARTTLDQWGWFAQARHARNVEIHNMGLQEWAVAQNTPMGKALTASGNQQRIAAAIRALGEAKYQSKLAADPDALGDYTGNMSLGQIETVINDGAARYTAPSDVLSDYNNRLMVKMVQSGLVSPDAALAMAKLYPDYVPLSRVAEAFDNKTQWSPVNPPGSIQSQRTIKKLKGGSEVPFEDPLATTLDKTTSAFREMGRNEVAKQLASRSTQPVWDQLISRKPFQGVPQDDAHTFSFLEGGKPVTMYVSDPFIAAAAKSLTPNQFRASLGSLGELFLMASRLVRLKATALNPAFIAANVPRDITTTLVTSSGSANTPAAIAKAAKGVLVKGQDWADLVNYGGGFTENVLFRDHPRLTLDMFIIAGQPGVEGKIAAASQYALRGLKTAISGSPLKGAVQTKDALLQALNTVENIGAKAEEVSRLRLFQAERTRLLSQGMNMDDATAAAAMHSTNALPNYNQSGLLIKAVAPFIPFLGATISGTKSMVDAVRGATPTKLGGKAGGGGAVSVSTLGKIATYIVLPSIVSTLYNMTSDGRKQAFDKIPQSEREGNWTLIPDPNDVDETGKVRVIQIPIQQPFNRINRLVQEGLIKMQNADPAEFQRMVKQYLDIDVGTTSLPNRFTGRELATTVAMLPSPKEVTKDEFLSLMPPLAYMGLEVATGKNFYTGQDYESDRLKNIADPTQRVDKDTSLVITALAQQFGWSPAYAQGVVNSVLGAPAMMAANVADRVGVKAGVLQGKPGGKSPESAVLDRFTTAAQVNPPADEEIAKQISKAGHDPISLPVREELRALRLTPVDSKPAENEPAELTTLRAQIRGVILNREISNIISDPRYATLTPTQRREGMEKALRSFSSKLTGLTSTDSYKAMDDNQRAVYLRAILSKIR